MRLSRATNGAMRGPIRILGIDPGLRRTGWGVLDVAGNRLRFLACGSVETDDGRRWRSGSSPSMTGSSA